MSKQTQQRIIQLQNQLKIAKDALERIKAGHHNANVVADGALDAIWRLDPKQPLQGLVGHGPRSNR